MALNTWADVDPKAKRVTAYYEGSNTIYEGMILHYNHDTTDNWSGIDRADGSESSTTTEGSQNEGRWIRLEEPSNANRRFPAGVVAKGSPGIGAAGPSLVDIYALNGAMVPVFTDRSVTINDKAYVELATNHVINEGTGDGPCIGYFVETIDRSTAGLALCKLQDPDISETKASSTLSVGLSPLLWGDAPTAAELADPGAGISYFDDFLEAANLVTTEGWVITQNTSGAMSLVAAEGGVLLIDSAGHVGAHDGVGSAQLLNCRFLPKAGTNIWFEARVKMNDASDEYFVGLCATDTTVLTTGGAIDDASDKCGFYAPTGGTDEKLSSITARTSADDATTDVVANTDATYITLGFKITGITTVDFYADGVLVESGAVTANVPNAAMCLSFASQCKATSVDSELSVDWVKIVQDVARTQ